MSSSKRLEIFCRWESSGDGLSFFQFKRGLPRTSVSSGYFGDANLHRRDPSHSNRSGFAAPTAQNSIEKRIGSIEKRIEKILCLVWLPTRCRVPGDVSPVSRPRYRIWYRIRCACRWVLGAKGNLSVVCVSESKDSSASFTELGCPWP